MSPAHSSAQTWLGPIAWIDEAYEMYAARWPEAGELGQAHAHYVHCYATLEDARNHTTDGKIYEIDTDALAEGYIDVEVDTYEFEHPAEYLTVAA